jgi:hypothetical protein
MGPSFIQRINRGSRRERQQIRQRENAGVDQALKQSRYICRVIDELAHLAPLVLNGPLQIGCLAPSIRGHQCDPRRFRERDNRAGERQRARGDHERVDPVCGHRHTRRQRARDQEQQG